MKGVLQFSNASVGPYSYAGLLRLKDDRFYKVTPVTLNDRESQPDVAAFKVEVNAVALQIDLQMYSQFKWYFRIYFPTENLEILLGERNFQPTYDARLSTNGIVYYKHRLEFIIDKANYVSYINPSTPAGGNPMASINLEEFDFEATIYV